MAGSLDERLSVAMVEEQFKRKVLGVLPNNYQSVSAARLLLRKTSDSAASGWPTSMSRATHTTAELSMPPDR